VSAAAWRRFWTQLRLRLHDRRFWIIQALVIGISIGHTTMEATHALGVLPDLYLLPVSTYFIPAVYAGLNFGLEGALPTAIWCCLLTLPNVLLFHRGWERGGVLIQLAIMVAVAIVIARRVEQETAAKARAEDALVELGRAQQRLEQYLHLATDAQEEERKRLARELHDETIQELLIARGRLESLHGERGLPAETGARVADIERLLEQTVDGVRRFSRDLRPSLLDDLGLDHAVDALASELSERTGIAVEVSTEGEPRRLEPNVELAVYRVVQEALRNVERHSGARHAKVGLAFAPASLTVTVVDDGSGFDAHAAAAPSHLGLMGMRERAKLAGAALEIRSRPGRGTRVTLRVDGAGAAAQSRASSSATRASRRSAAQSS
jgi:two-component system, NarL family, sensor histidine kinase DegS